MFATKLSNVDNNERANNKGNNSSSVDNAIGDSEWNIWKRILALKNSDKIVENFRPSNLK